MLCEKLVTFAENWIILRLSVHLGMTVSCSKFQTFVKKQSNPKQMHEVHSTHRDAD